MHRDGENPDDTDTVRDVEIRLPGIKESSLMDADERAGVLISALRQAHARVVNSPDDSPETLKVFLAPEFFFRGPTPYRVDAFAGGRRNPVARILLALKAEMVQEKMANWILVAGTIVAKGSDPASNSFHNFAPVLVGGPARHACADGTPKFDHYLMRKRSESLIDHATKRTKDLPPAPGRTSTRR